MNIGETYCLVTRDPFLVDDHNADTAEVIDFSADEQMRVRVKFPNGDTAPVSPEELYDVDKVPFKRGDTCKNKFAFTTLVGGRGWPGMEWKIKQVTYDTLPDGSPDFEQAVLICDCNDFLVWGQAFFLNQVTKE